MALLIMYTEGGETLFKKFHCPNYSTDCTKFTLNSQRMDSSMMRTVHTSKGLLEGGVPGGRVFPQGDVCSRGVSPHACLPTGGWFTKGYGSEAEGGSTDRHPTIQWAKPHLCTE